MAKTILEEAMEDARLLKETAIENAKNVLVEAISPKIKEFVDSQLGESEMYEEPLAASANVSEESDDEGSDDEAGEDGGADEMEMGGEEADLELLAKLLKKLGVETNVGAGAAPGMDMGMEMGESVDESNDVSEAKDDKDDDKVEEVVEITNEDLKTALSEVLGNMGLKSEATVTKGFGDVQDATIKNAGGAGAKGIADEKSGEHQWNDETPPAAKDWTVKEAAYRNKIASYANAVKLLQNENSQYKQALAFLKRNLQEVNLFNSKLVYTNKLLQGAKLNKEQRSHVIETFDKAQSMREVELVYKSLSESLKIAGVLGESKQPQRLSLKGPKGSRYVTPGSSVLNESAENGSDNFAERMKRLAGLVD